MLIKRILILVTALLMCGTGVVFAAVKNDLQIRVLVPGATVSIDQYITDGRLLVDVVDSQKNPLFGLSTKDFSVTQSGRQAITTSVRPLAESLDVPRHIVLVLDNSFSMEERKAIKPLLDGVKELLKIVRPIDDVQIVVFDGQQTIQVGDRNLRVKTFHSNQPTDLIAYAENAYALGGVTRTTVLYEGMLAGLDLIGKMPATEPRFLVVFSDGEDLNSAFKEKDVTAAAQGLGNFNVYAIDYMDTPKTDKFLSTFSRQNHGQIWKAKSDKNLTAIFQSVAAKMEFFYVVNYEFLTTGSLTVTPATLTFNEVQSATMVSKIDVSTLTLRPIVNSAYDIARWKVIVSNTHGTVTELSGEGAPAPELIISLPTADLQTLSTGGDLIVKMEVQDQKGKTLLLTTPPVKVIVLQTTASLTVTPNSLTIEEIRTIETSPMLAQLYFAKGANELPSRYLRLAGAPETAAFDEQTFRDSREKHYQLLNIIGKRLTINTSATISLVGCNDNNGVEKGNKELSRQRAEAVKDYLVTVWRIAPERILIEARNLPALPSSSRLAEGQAENRRVEIHATDALILAPIKSSYLATRIDTPDLTLQPTVVSPHGIAKWKIDLTNATTNLTSLSGNGAPVKESQILLENADLNALATGGDMTVNMEVEDLKGQKMVLAPVLVKVNFIQISQRLAQKEGMWVREKYALILFDFDKETIDGPNQEIISKIVDRIKMLPDATTIEIVGHTDNIGKAEYNVGLSERRALAAYKLLTATYGETAGDRFRQTGVGPERPLYDNLSPETRAFNRTVTITLEYQSAE